MIETLSSVLNECQIFENHPVWDIRGRTVSKAEDSGEMQGWWERWEV